MRCPKCGQEPRHRLLSSPCPNKDCGFIWWDTEDYIRHLSKNLVIETVLDIGVGQKGILAQEYWQGDRNIPRGYACDIFTIKTLPASPWIPLLMDAENLVDKLGPKSIDMVTHAGCLEHVEYAKAFRILRVVEQLAKKMVFFTCSAVCRDVTYKVEHDGNPYHYYRSFWDGDIFEALGYTVDRIRMCKGETFLEEVTCWYDPTSLGPWKPRAQRAIDLLTNRHCFVDGCRCEPVWWDPRLDNRRGGSLCFKHAEERNAKQSHGAAPIKRWYDDPEKLKQFPVPPWRDPLPLF